jgi:hypothetical protein
MRLRLRNTALLTHLMLIITHPQDPEKGFVVKAGTLGFSVTIYTIFAILGILLILARRFLGIFGNAELGGNNGKLALRCSYKKATFSPQINLT